MCEALHARPLRGPRNDARCKKHAWNWLFCRMDSVDSEVFLEALEVEDVELLALYFEQAILLHR